MQALSRFLSIFCVLFPILVSDRFFLHLTINLKTGEEYLVSIYSQKFYQIMHQQDNCSPSTHRQEEADYSHNSIHKASQDLDAAGKRSYRSHLQTLCYLDMILTIASLPRSVFHLVTFPVLPNYSHVSAFRYSDLKNKSPCTKGDLCYH